MGRSKQLSTKLAARFKLSRDQVSYGLPMMDVRDTSLGDSCPLEVDFPCQPRKYRAFSGYCNNVQSPHWGKANTRYLRFLPAEYSDGVSLPRGIGHSLLPSPREVSLSVHKDEDLPHPHLMAITVVWGEFISHDMAHTPQMTGIKTLVLTSCFYFSKQNGATAQFYTSGK